MRGPRSAGEAANAGVLGSERIDQGRSPLPTPVSGDSEGLRAALAELKSDLYRAMLVQAGAIVGALVGIAGIVLGVLRRME